VRISLDGNERNRPFPCLDRANIDHAELAGRTGRIEKIGFDDFDDAGDFLADSSDLGFAGGAPLLAGLLVLTVLANFYSQISKTLAFWMLFILTRPLGATMGRQTTQRPSGLRTRISSQTLPARSITALPRGKFSRRLTIPQ
jgi:hypothetical protein